MSVPDFSTLAESVFNSYPEDVTRLNALCDQCEADRAQFGEDDPRVQAGESKVNNLKGLFTRRIAWACFQQDDRFGLRRKTSGAVATRADGVQHSTDALMLHDDGQIVDVMSDRKWSWNATPGDTQPREQWVKPLPPEGDAVPAPTPLPVPVPVPTPEPTDSHFEARIAQLEAWVTAAKGILQTMEDRELNTLQGLGSLKLRVDDLEARPIPAPGQPKLVAVGTIRLFGYGFNVRLPVEKA